MKLERILERHDDVGTVGYMLYSDNNGKLYADPGFKDPLTVEEVGNAFVKGCVVNKDGVLSRPAALNADGTLSYGGGGQKLYRHHIMIAFEDSDDYGELTFDLYNTESVNYSAQANWTEDEELYEDLTDSDFDFMINAGRLHANGYMFSFSDDVLSTIVGVRFYDGLDVEYFCDGTGLSSASYYVYEIYSISDVVTEVK